MKKPPRPSRFAEDAEERRLKAQRREATLARLEAELRQHQEWAAAAQGSDPYNTAGPAPGVWNNGRKR